MKIMPKGIRARTLIAVIAVMLVLTSAVGVTLAWLSDTHKIETVVFKDSDINIVFEDEKSSQNVKLVPGHTVDKDPVVTVKAGSEKCYLFVKLGKNIGDNGESLLDSKGNEIAVFDDLISYNVIEADEPGADKGWVKLKDKNGNEIKGVYYKVIETSGKDQVYRVLEGGSHTMGSSVYTWDDGQILINPEITLEMQSAIVSDNYPELTLTAYAIQYFKSNDLPFKAYEAWANVSA